MITDLILNVLFFLPCSLLAGLDAININLFIPDDIYITLSDICKCVGYVLPVSALLPIFLTRLALKLVQITIAIVIRIKSFIPTMGA